MLIFGKIRSTEYIGNHQPNATENLPGLYLGKLYLDYTTGSRYICTDATPDANVWQIIGTGSAPIPQLNAPTANTDKTTAGSGESITLTATNVDPNATGVSWYIGGDYSIVSGDLQSTTLVIQSGTAGTVTAKVKAVGDGATYSDSDYSNTVSITITSAITYDTSLVDGESKEGITLTDPNGVGTFYFNKKAYDNSIPADIMFFSINGVLVKIDYATEYEGDNFMMEEAATGDRYCGTIASNGDSSNPTVINLC